MTENFSFKQFTAESALALTSIREGEKKIGQSIKTDPFDNSVKYVILGIEESVGPRANLGLKGAENAFRSFLSRFLNMQDNRYIDSDKIALGGYITANIEPDNVEHGRILINELDGLVSNTVQPWMNENKTIIVVGGGHNNAYPLIKAAFNSKNTKVSVINLDPHADCRKLEGRHSGNPFSFAKEEGMLEDYTVLGLHRAYNSEHILDYLDQKKFQYTFFDEYIGNKSQFNQDIIDVKDRHKDKVSIGIELDLDSIAGMPSSAFTPSGFNIEDARLYLRIMASIPNIKYVHLPEGAPTNPAEEKIVGKSLAYLIWEFISSRSKNL